MSSARYEVRWLEQISRYRTVQILLSFGPVFRGIPYSMIPNIYGAFRRNSIPFATAKVKII